MKIAVLGTGIVGRALAAKLADVGHEVTIGTRAPVDTLARTGKNSAGLPAFADWQGKRGAVGLATFAAAAQFAELVINALSGQASLAGLELAGAKNLEGKILIDVSNPLDFSGGMPPSLFVGNTDSLGETIQRAFPDVRVVKTLNTVATELIVDPHSLAGGDHSVFVSGNDGSAKEQVATLLQDEFGWRDVIDLRDITTARGTEAYLALWIRLWGTVASRGIISPVWRAQFLRPVWRC